MQGMPGYTRRHEYIFVPSHGSQIERQTIKERVKYCKSALWLSGTAVTVFVIMAFLQNVIVWG